uniref:Nucleoporin NDC1 n=1 Tax=Oreochromis niloticus TaxID=8128 RepID=A0A669DWS3_ORENI
MQEMSDRLLNNKAAASIAWAVLLLPPSTAIFVILSKFSVLHPIQTISECFSMLTSATAIFSFILLCGVIIMVGFLNFEYYTVIPTIACSKIALFGQLLHPRQLVNSLVHCIMGMIVAWCSAVTIGFRYETLGHPCAQTDGYHQMCLNEYHLILLLGGAFVGFSHSLLGVIHNMNYVSFHTVQQYKYLRFKGCLPLVVKCSATQALYSVRNFIVVYYFLGYIPRTWICKTLNLHLGSSAHPLDSIAGLLDLSLLYHLWISATFLLFTWYITLLLFRIFLTEHIHFRLNPTDHQILVLSFPKFQFLALQDLALLSQHSPLRRCEVFSLSQPGGHPHNWNAISKECLSLLADLTQRLVAYHDTVATNGRAKSLSSGSERKTSSETSGTLISQKWLSIPLTAPFTPDLDSPFMSPALRRLAAPVEQGSPWYGTVQSPHIMRRVKNFLAKRVLIVYLFNKLPEASSQALFADSQAHIWALEGLSYLVQASFSEDQFGVVQTTLPSILSCMLVLQEAVDRHFKLPHASSKPVRSTSSMGDSTYKTLRFALRATLKTAIYRITTTFGDHLNAVQLSAEHRKRLQQFLEYKE